MGSYWFWGGRAAGSGLDIDDDPPLDAEPCERVREAFPAAAEAIPRARQLLRAWLDYWGLATVSSPLELAVGELVTNAVRHGEGPVELVAAVRPGQVRIEVHDSGGGHPGLRQPAVAGAAPGGWGLQMVDQLVDAWGSEVTSQHTVVWIELAVPPVGRPHQP